ncbi:hypothetical protein LEP1GSC170_3627 [Leptospira interrogans serovar Bataviae str. HAI135]|nr:hypothetical protein LEP1GSC170_3627 [Leptospira interrogans serovar Bataviae str. HAI135]
MCGSSQEISLKGNAKTLWEIDLTREPDYGSSYILKSILKLCESFHILQKLKSQL